MVKKPLIAWAPYDEVHREENNDDKLPPFGGLACPFDAGNCLSDI